MSVLFCLSPRGQTFLTHRGTYILYTRGAWFSASKVGTLQTFYVGWGGGYTIMMLTLRKRWDTSEANILVSKASKLAEGARIFRDL